MNRKKGSFTVTLKANEEYVLNISGLKSERWIRKSELAREIKGAL